VRFFSKGEDMNKEFKRVIWIILDSVGIGEASDAKEFGDEGADTLGHIFNQFPSLKVDNLIKLGLSNIDDTNIPKLCNNPIGIYGKAKQISAGKDTTIGHWEMIGVSMKEPFPTYPNGFPDYIVNEFIKLTGVPGILGNCTASGTEIIQRLGEEHIITKRPIIYTSADSVFQIACLEDVYSVDELYHMCKVARNILCGKDGVARVIARPFNGMAPFNRTSNRRDFSLVPDSNNLLEYLKNDGHNVCAVGKIEDIFAGSGITSAIHTIDNGDGIDKTIQYMNDIEEGLIFTNLVDFDSKWGHRRDVKGYSDGLVAFDKRLPEIISNMKEDDLLIINADHGCDPTFKGTDHTREYIPLIVYSKKLKKGLNLGVRNSFADIGATIAQNFKVHNLSCGDSFLDKIKEACR
jgi:phosphopentomutase